MKKITKIALPVVALLSVALTTGCGGRKTDTDDPTKTNIHIHNYNGGIGSEWLSNAVARFETKFADYSFEEGKTGVKVHMTNNKVPLGDISGENFDKIGRAHV